MNIFNDDFKDFILYLNQNEVEYIVVGGYAVIIRGYSRSTGDIDIWVNGWLINAFIGQKGPWLSNCIYVLFILAKLRPFNSISNDFKHAIVGKSNEYDNSQVEPDVKSFNDFKDEEENPEV